MNAVLAIFLGGGLGAVSRHFSIIWAARLFGEGFPAGTLLVNVAGSLLIGFLLEGSALKWNLPLELRALLVTGFLGGFTTFSAFSFDFYKLVGTAQMQMAAIYVMLSVVLSLAAVFGGVFLARGIFQ